MSRPAVSVLIPAFNAASTVGDAIRSARSQTLADIEIFVVDDGSRDDTASVVSSAGEGDERVVLIRKNRGGVSAARNAAIAAASGKYVAPLDADDIWHPEKLAKQVAVAEAATEPLGFVYTYFRRIDEAGQVVTSGAPVAVCGRALHRHLYSNFVGNGSTILMPRRVAVELGGYDESLISSEDYFLQLRIAARYPIGVVPEYLVGYRLTPGSMTECRDNMFEAWLDLRSRLPVACPGMVRDPTARIHATKCLDIVPQRLRQRRPLAAAGLLARAALSDPLTSFFQFQHRLGRLLRRRFLPAEPPGPQFSDVPVEPGTGDYDYRATGAMAVLRWLDERRSAALAPLDLG